MTAIKTTLLTLTFIAVQFFGGTSAAEPEVISLSHYTDRFGPHSIPGLPVGDKVQINAFIDTNDPQGSPMISVKAVHGSTTLTLDALITPVYPPPLHPYQKYIDFDPGLLESWEVIPTDSTGIGPSAFTNSIPEPEFVPLVENLKVGGTPVGSSVSWVLPNLDGFDVDIVFVRVIESISGNQVYNSPPLPFQTTSFEPPAGELKYGVDYEYRIMLNDFEGVDPDVYPENRSNTFSESFRYMLPGDYNTNGTVDAADYVFWRKGLGTTYDQNDYGVWRSHFGASFDPGSGSALPSAEPLSAAVPEAASFALMLLASISVALSRLRR